MTATRLGAVDMRPLQELLYKPAHSLAMSFSTDPNHGVESDRFNGGPAVVFLATTTFTSNRRHPSLHSRRVHYASL